MRRAETEAVARTGVMSEKNELLMQQLEQERKKVCAECLAMVLWLPAPQLGVTSLVVRR